MTQLINTTIPINLLTYTYYSLENLFLPSNLLIITLIILLSIDIATLTISILDVLLDLIIINIQLLLWIGIIYLIYINITN